MMRTFISLTLAGLLALGCGGDGDDGQAADQTDDGSEPKTDVSDSDVPDDTADPPDEGPPPDPGPDDPGPPPDVPDPPPDEGADEGLDVPEPPDEGPDPDPDTDDAPDVDPPDGGDTVDPPPVYDCAVVTSLPLKYETLTGYSGSEDFAFDTDGSLVSNKSGNLTRQKMGQPAQLFVPNVGTTAGMAFLSTGDLIVASVSNGALWRVAPNGAKVTVISGLSYPNGLDVDENDNVFVAEQSGGRLRKVHPYTGEFEILAEKMPNPNGVSFGPGYTRVYVGSFGAGTVHYLEKQDDGGWKGPILLGYTPGASPPKPVPEACAGLDAGSVCVNEAGVGLCVDSSKGKECMAAVEAPDPFISACDGAAGGDACAVSLFDTNYTGQCESFGAITYCEVASDKLAPCKGKSSDDGCVFIELGYPVRGHCDNDGKGLECKPGFNPNPGGGGGGGLDGLNVDACGWIYVTEYIAGIIWRFSPDGLVEEAVKLPSSWIPNMHFGNGIGGWDPEILYVMDRDQGRVFALKVEKPGKEVTAP